jgi:hypothetical protein
MGKTYLMSQKEMPRAGLIRAALAGKVTNAEGAGSLGLSVRQFQRLKIRYRDLGSRGLLHRRRGCPSGTGLCLEDRKKIKEFMQSRYDDLNDCHLTEKLREVEKIMVSRATVRRIRLELKRGAKRKRRTPRHRSRRLREAREGALVQIDGSPHDWLQGRGPEMSLIGAVDDATGKVLQCVFRLQEDLHGYAALFHRVFQHHGLPLAFYGDGTSILVRNDDHWTLQEELAGRQNPTHLGQALLDLGIAYLHAKSPQAKGRVENRWGTFQDRLVAEMRLRGLSTLEQANAYLPEFLDDFNQRFALAPREASSAWRKPPPGWQLALCCRYVRTVGRDNTVQLGPTRERDLHHRPAQEHRDPIVSVARRVQIPPGPGGRSFAGCRVELRELLDGRITVHYQNQVLTTVAAPEGPFRLSPRPHDQRSLTSHKSKPPATSRPRRNLNLLPKRPAKPANDHPWRREIVRTTATTLTRG